MSSLLAAPSPGEGNPLASLAGLPEAELARVATMLAQHLAAAASLAVNPIPFARFRDEVLALYRPPLRAKATMTKMRQALNIAAELVGDGTTEGLTPALVARFVNSRPPGQSSETTEGLLRNLSRACNYAVGRGYLRVSPFADRRRWVRPAPSGRPRKRHHSADDIAGVLELARQDIARKVPRSWSQWRARRLYALVATVAYTGLRRNEALRLRVEDLDLGKRVIWVLPRRGSELKTSGSEAPIPIPDALAGILADWLPYLRLPEGMGEVAGPEAVNPASNPAGRRDPGWVFPNAYRTGPWTGGSPGQKPLDRLKRLGERAGVEGLTFLSLRHTWATMAESRWGFSEAMIQRVLRHTSRRTQQHYRHADVPNLREAVRGLGFGTEAEAVPLPEAAWSAAFGVPEAKAVPLPEAVVAELKRSPKAGGPKLSAEDVAEMKELRDRGWTYARLMGRYGVSKSTLHYALYGVTHKPPARPEAES